MHLLDLFKKKAKKTSPQAGEGNALEIYSDMRVEVTTFEGKLLFVAKLINPHGTQAELHQYSETESPMGEEALHVRIRGYSDHEQEAVYMEGVITPQPRHIWNVEQLTVARIGNDRAFFRLDTNLPATAFSDPAVGARPCRLLNISVGGACISSDCRYREGDKLLLKVRLMEDRRESAMYCQVLRVVEKDDGQFEYGCRFLELTKENQEKIVQNIFAAQRQRRNR